MLTCYLLKDTEVAQKGTCFSEQTKTAGKQRAVTQSKVIQSRSPMFPKQDFLLLHVMGMQLQFLHTDLGKSLLTQWTERWSHL